MKLLKDLENHLSTVKKERAYYKQVCEEVKQNLPANLPLGNHPACSFEGTHHVSFDFAQQMHYPQDPQQPGPIYFKTPRKCGLFGLNSEVCGIQMNYLVDKAHSAGKGANVVISYLHDYLENHSLGETNLHLHADNCAGQNKNNQMMWYILWRCLTGRNNVVQLSFLIAGHTKFSPDGGFGLIKRKLRRTKVDCLQDIVDVVNSSSQMNVGKLIGKENGPSEVPTYDWTSYLSQFFVKLKGIKGFHHFRMDRTGSVKAKANIDADEQSFDLLRKMPEPNAMPEIIPKAGLSAQRQAYLYKEIRPFVAEDKRDIVTPLPTLPIPAEETNDEDEDTPVPQKKAKPGQQANGLNARGRGRGRGQFRKKTQQ